MGWNERTRTIIISCQSNWSNEVKTRPELLLYVFFTQMIFHSFRSNARGVNSECEVQTRPECMYYTTRSHEQLFLYTSRGCQTPCATCYSSKCTTQSTHTRKTLTWYGIMVRVMYIPDTYSYNIMRDVLLKEMYRSCKSTACSEGTCILFESHTSSMRGDSSLRAHCGHEKTIRRQYTHNAHQEIQPATATRGSRRYYLLLHATRYMLH